jgi:histone deacetylase 1/2
MAVAECGKQWQPAPAQSIRRFHTDAYVHFLEQIELHGKEVAEEAANFALNASVCFSETAWCAAWLRAPAWHQPARSASPPHPPCRRVRTRPYSCIYAGASMAAAQQLVAGATDVAISWAGGQTHARRDCASGFSYVNDAVLATLQLLQGFERVLFVSLDACHASGVEEAFYTTDRVLFLSLHRHGEGFFPGSGGARDIGEGAGLYHNINLPVAEGLTDADLDELFTPVLTAAAFCYQPHALVICAGTGLLSGDRLGCMNVSLDGYLGALNILLDLSRPTLLLGGSGYTQSTAARAWCAATALACDVELDDAIPDHDFRPYYAPAYRLKLDLTTLTNSNTPATLAATQAVALETVAAMPARGPRAAGPAAAAPTPAGGADAAVLRQPPRPNATCAPAPSASPEAAPAASRAAAGAAAAAGVAAAAEAAAAVGSAAAAGMAAAAAPPQQYGGEPAGGGAEDLGQRSPHAAEAMDVDTEGSAEPLLPPATQNGPAGGAGAAGAPASGVSAE